MKAALAFCAGLVVALGGHASADPDETPEMRASPPPAQVADLKLPDGRLAALGGTAKAFGFLDLDDIQRSASDITAVIYGVYDPPLPAGSYRSNQVVRRVVFDCATGKNTTLGSLAFDQEGRLVMWTPTDPQVVTERNSIFGVAAEVLCHGQSTPNVVTGHAAALALSKQLLGGQASAQPTAVNDCLSGSVEANDRVTACSSALSNKQLTPEEQSTAYWARGDAYARMNETAEALADFGKAIALKPSAPSAYESRAAIYAKQGNFGSAISDLDQVIRLQPGDYIDYALRGADEEHAGDLNSAVADFDKVIELAPTYPDGYEGRGVAFDMGGDPMKALPDLAKAVSLKPDSGAFLTGLAAAEGETGELDKAMADLDRSIELDPKLATSYETRGLIHVRRHELDAGAADFSQAITLDPNLAEAYRNRAVAEAMKGRVADAVADLDQALRVAPNRAEYYVLRGIAERSLGRAEASAADFAKADVLQPGISQQMAGH